MLKPNSTKLNQNASLAAAVAEYKAKGGEIKRADHPGVGEGLLRRPYLKGKNVYGAKKKSA